MTDIKIRKKLGVFLKCLVKQKGRSVLSGKKIVKSFSLARNSKTSLSNEKEMTTDRVASIKMGRADLSGDELEALRKILHADPNVSSDEPEEFQPIEENCQRWDEIFREAEGVYAKKIREDRDIEQQSTFPNQGNIYQNVESGKQVSTDEANIYKEILDVIDDAVAHEAYSAPVYNILHSVKLYGFRRGYIENLNKENIKKLVAAKDDKEKIQYFNVIASLNFCPKHSSEWIPVTQIIEGLNSKDPNIYILSICWLLEWFPASNQEWTEENIKELYPAVEIICLSVNNKGIIGEASAFIILQLMRGIDNTISSFPFSQEAINSFKTIVSSPETPTLILRWIGFSLGKNYIFLPQRRDYAMEWAKIADKVKKRREFERFIILPYMTVNSNDWLSHTYKIFCSLSDQDTKLGLAVMFRRMGIVSKEFQPIFEKYILEQPLLNDVCSRRLKCELIMYATDFENNNIQDFLYRGATTDKNKEKIDSDMAFLALIGIGDTKTLKRLLVNYVDADADAYSIAYAIATSSHFGVINLWSTPWWRKKRLLWIILKANLVVLVSIRPDELGG